MITRHRCQVHHDDGMRSAVKARVRQHRLPFVGDIDPRESRRIMIMPPQTGLGAIQRACRCHERLQSSAHRILEQTPFETGIMIPFTPGPQLRSHEKYRLARTRDRVADQRAQIGHALPFVARHLAKQGALHVHHFIVRQRIHKPLAVLVHHRERQFIVRPLPEKRIHLVVVQGVVHPPHVPLEGEAQSAISDGVCYPRPCGAFLGNRHHTRMQRVHRVIELFEKCHRVQVFPSTQSIAQPCVGFTPVIQIQH